MISGGWNVYTARGSVDDTACPLSQTILVPIFGYFTAWQALLHCLVTGRNGAIITLGSEQKTTILTCNNARACSNL